MAGRLAAAIGYPVVLTIRPYAIGHDDARAVGHRASGCLDERFACAVPLLQERAADRSSRVDEAQDAHAALLLPLLAQTQAREQVKLAVYFDSLVH